MLVKEFSSMEKDKPQDFYFTDRTLQYVTQVLYARVFKGPHSKNLLYFQFSQVGGIGLQSRGHNFTFRL